MDFRIKHVIQTLSDNCVSASLSMLTGIHIDKITEVFHQDFKKNCYKVNEHTFLKSLGIEHELLNPIVDYIDDGYFYLCTVPSLNTVAGNHSVIMYLDKDDKLVVLDPNKGRADKFWYTLDPDCEDEMSELIKGYAPTLRVKMSDVKQSYVDQEKINVR
jgi:hypothetical protein